MQFYLLMIKKSDVALGKRYRYFGNFIEIFELQDLGFSKPSFTWQSGERVKDLIGLLLKMHGYQLFHNARSNICLVSNRITI